MVRLAYLGEQKPLQQERLTHLFVVYLSLQGYLIFLFHKH